MLRHGLGGAQNAQFGNGLEGDSGPETYKAFSGTDRPGGGPWSRGCKPVLRRQTLNFRLIR